MAVVVFCDGADKSLEEALKHLSGRVIQEKAAAGLRTKIELLENNHVFAKDTVRTEGELPNGKKFFAIVHRSLRCYFWSQDDDIYISHFIYKNFPKLRESDTTKVQNNWRTYNEQNEKQI